MKDIDEIRKIIDGEWYYKCNHCGRWKVGTDYNVDKHNTVRHGRTSRCKECLKLINHFDKGYLTFRNSPIKDGKLYCNRCRSYKDFCEFDRQSSAKHRMGYGYLCKDCRSKTYKKYRTKITLDPDKALRVLISNRIEAAKRRALHKNLDFTISFDTIYDLWNRQKGLCAISKIPMTLIIGQNRSLYNMSLDRIDSSKGYTPDNVQLVCDIVNRMKLDASLQEFINLCRLISNNYDT